MKQFFPHTLEFEFSDPRKANALLSALLFLVLSFFAIRPELSILGEILRIAVAAFAMILSLMAAFSFKTRTVYLINIFLSLFFFSLFVVTFAVRVYGVGDWYVSEIFQISLLDVFLTAFFSVSFYMMCLNVSIDVFDEHRK